MKNNELINDVIYDQLNCKPRFMGLRLTNPSDLIPCANLSELGADSLDIIEIVMFCESTLNIDIDDEQLENITTVGDIYNLFENK